MKKLLTLLLILFCSQAQASYLVPGSDSFHIQSENYISFPNLGFGILKSSEDLPLQRVPNNKNYLYSDPLYSNQQPYLNIAAIPEAWSTTEGRDDFVVAVVDTGVAYNHEDIRANMWFNAQEIPNIGIDVDGNGLVDDYYGASFTNGGATATGDPDDVLYAGGGHGTHVAGTIASPVNNVGIIGVAPRVKIMAVRVFTDDYAEDVDLVRAFDYIIGMKNRGVNVKAVNLSLGTVPGEEQANTALQLAMTKLAEADILVVIAAGNASTNISLPNKQAYPACYECTTKVVVGACASSGQDLAYFSNYGSNVDLLAPGVSIWGPVPEFAGGFNGNYTTMSGTSMATPITVGVAMLLWTQNPSYTALQLKNLLLEKGTYIPNLTSYCSTSSVVSAVKQTNPTIAPTQYPRPTAKPDPIDEILGGAGCSVGSFSWLSALVLFPLFLFRR